MTLDMSIDVDIQSLSRFDRMMSSDMMRLARAERRKYDRSLAAMSFSDILLL